MNIHKAPNPSWNTSLFAGGSSEIKEPKLPSPTEYDTERMEHAKTLLELGPHECKWPLNDGGPYLFCAEATNGAAYCRHHALRSLPADKRSGA